MAKIQARWGSFKFVINSKIIKGIESLSLSRGLNFDKTEATGEKDKINVKGFNLEVIPITYTPAIVAGAVPRTEYEAWKAALGKKAFLYIGGRRWGDSKYILTKASLSAKIIDNEGRIHIGQISLEFNEDYKDVTALPGEKKTETRTTAVDVGPTRADKKKIVKGG